MKAWVMHLVVVSGLTATVLLTACSGSGSEPNCSGKETISLVKQTYTDAIDKVLTMYQKPELRTLVDSVTLVEVRNVTTTGKDTNVGRLTCQAEVSVSVPPNLYRVLSSPGHPLALAAQAANLTTKDGRIEREIEYETQLTDDKTVRVATEGADVLGGAIAMYAMSGFLSKETSPK